MKEQEKLKLWVIWLVALIGFIVGVIAFVWRIKNGQSPLIFVLVALFYGFALYYGLKGYQTPHVNMVQVLMLTLAVYVALSVIVPDKRWGGLPWIILLANNLAAVFMGFMAGRLNKVEENKFTALLISVLLFVRCLWFLENFNMTGTDITLFVLDRSLALFMWIVLVLIYFFRYEKHKETGLSATNKLEV